MVWWSDRSDRWSERRLFARTPRAGPDYLPTIDRSVQFRASLARFHEFIRCTNQLELLIRDSEIFRYKVVTRAVSGGVERLTIEEEPRTRRPIRFAAVDGGMCEFLSREIESNKPDCRIVILTGLSEDALISAADQEDRRMDGRPRGR